MTGTGSLVAKLRSSSYLLSIGLDDRRRGVLQPKHYVEALSRVETLVDGAERLNLRLTPEQVRLFQVYYDELVADAGRSGLTAITDYEGVQRRHFLESLALLVSLERAGALGPAIDIGSGAGLPGLRSKSCGPLSPSPSWKPAARRAIFWSA